MMLGILQTMERLSKKEISYDIKDGKLDTLVELDFSRSVAGMLDGLLIVLKQKICIILYNVLLISYCSIGKTRG